MAQIKIFSDTNKGCIFFDGSTVEPKFIGTIAASIKSDEADRIVIVRNDRYEADQITFRKLFKRLNPSRVQNEAGENLVADLGYTIQQVVTYINGEASDFQQSSSVDVDSSIDFSLDATSTSILVSDGNSYGVNTLKAILGSDNLVYIKTHDNTHVTVYKINDENNIQINGAAVAGGLSDIVNTLNELFTVGAFEQIVIADPYSTMVADVNGVDTAGTLVGDALDPSGTDIGAGQSSHYNKAGYKSTDTIDQAGEYFTFDIRNESIMGFGLVLNDIADVNGNSTYGDPTKFCDGVTNSGNYGLQFGHFFHPSPNGPWTNYGANAGLVYGSGWNGADAFASSDEGADWLAGNNVKMKVGIDESGFIAISYYDVSSQTFKLCVRTNYPVAEGVKFHLGIKFCDANARLVTTPKTHLLEATAPTMYFRYIESPDGVYNYPLFATAEEANYYDEIHNGLTAGTGQSHTHTYNDDPTNTTWYMPEASHDPTNYSFSTIPAATTFNGNAVTYTTITSLTNADLTPAAFSGSNITQEEGTAVNLQVTPAGASWSTSVTISPASSGLVFDGTALIQGTLTDVGSDTTYTVTVVRANSYGSSTGTMTITATDVAPVQTNDTPWTKALDFSGTSEHTRMLYSSTAYTGLRMGGAGNTVIPNADNNKTTASTGGRPWATVVVFKGDQTSGGQYVWNQGGGSANNMDNLAVRVNQDHLYFSWGRDAYQSICNFHQNLDPNEWYGVYIAHKGARYSNTTNNAANMADAFDIRMMSSADNFATLSSNLSTVSNWITTSGMHRAMGGQFTIGGQGSDKSFNGKVASMVQTTLIIDRVMPVDAEIEMMIKDPIKWVTDYKLGTLHRQPYGYYGAFNFAINGNHADTSNQATQVWLMGDGVNDSYANGIRSYISPADWIATKLELNSMVSNDIETVNINGLT